MRKYLPPKCSYVLDNGIVRTDGSVKGKVTGTMVAGILGISPWSTPFQVACRLLGLAEEDISDKPAVKAGRALERLIIDYVAERYSSFGMFMSADEIYEKREGDHASWASDFDDDHFAGHVDGIVFDPDGEDYILEVKTSGNMQAWENGVPDYYYWQVALYNEFITHKEEAFVVLGIVSEEARRRPESWVPSDDNVVLFKLPIDTVEVRERLDTIRKWYDAFIAKGITPPYDPNNAGDAEMYSHLMRMADTDDSMVSMLDTLVKVEETLDRHDAEIKGLRATRDRLKSVLKDYMTAHDMSTLGSSDGRWQAVMNRQVRRTVDPALLMADGIDPKPYMQEKVSTTFTVKPFKDTQNKE